MNSRKAALLIAIVLAGANTGSVQAHSTSLKAEIILDYGNPGTTLSKGSNTLEQATFNCLHTNCAVAMSLMSSVSQATCKDEWAIVGLMDGSSVGSQAPLDHLPTAGNTQTRLWVGSTFVGYGSHTATFQVYVPCPATANQWSVRYNITRNY